MSASSSWFFSFTLAVAGCSSSSPELAPAGAPQTDPLPLPRPDTTDTDVSLPGSPAPGTPPTSPSQDPAPRGGQSGTDSEGAYNCNGEGAPPLVSVSLDATPDGYSCSPAALLAAISGSRTFEECTVYRSHLVPPADAGPVSADPYYEYSQSPGPSVTVNVEPGAAAHLLDAVLTNEDGSTGSCTLLGVDVSANITSAEAGLVLHTDHVISDRFCSSPGVQMSARLNLFGSEEAVTVILYFEGLTGRVSRLTFFGQTYTMECVDWLSAPLPADAGVGG